MMKTITLRALALVAMSTLITSCNNQAPKMDDEPLADEGGATLGMNIAFIEIDSLTSQYEFAKQTTLELEKKSTNARNTIQSKTQQLEKNVAAFQQKLQSNGFTSREQAENAQAALQREQNNIVALQQRLEAELANEQQKFLEAFQDSLDNYLRDYNRDKENKKLLVCTDEGVKKVERAFGIESLYSGEGNNMLLLNILNQMLKAFFVFQRDKDYIVKDDAVVIVDDFTGRLMDGRRYSDGLHQAIEAKEDVKMRPESTTLATITFQNFFRMYKKLSGMTGTAKTEEKENISRIQSSECKERNIKRLRCFKTKLFFKSSSKT